MAYEHRARHANFIMGRLIGGMVVAVLLGPGVSWAADYTWLGGTGLWNSTNWTTGSGTFAGPTTAGNAAIINSGTAQLNNSDIFGNGGAATSTTQITVNSGATLNTNNTTNPIVGLTLNGGSMLIYGGHSSTWGGVRLSGTLTAGGSAASTINTGNVNPGAEFIGVGNSAVGNLTVNVGAASTLTINARMWDGNWGSTPSHGINKIGLGKLTLTATNNSYQGATTVGDGVLAVNGQITSPVTVQSGATIGGSGVIVGTVGGDGRIAPGNSAGILTIQGQVAPTSTTSFAFEFSGTGAPTWSNASASVNDVLRLTAATPLASALAATNTVNIYLDVSSVAQGDTFLGGLYSDQTAGSLDFGAAIGTPAYQFFVRGDGNGGASYNGTNYYTLGQFASGYTVTASVVTVPLADFSGGNVTNGQVTQFVVVPEPATYAWIGLALIPLAFRRSWRLR